MREPENRTATDGYALATSRAERLRLAHADAVSEIERDRNQPGQLTTGINGEVGVSILNAGLLALTEEGGGHSDLVGGARRGEGGGLHQTEPRVLLGHCLSAGCYGCVVYDTLPNKHSETERKHWPRSVPNKQNTEVSK
jgi:hypothetical protein